MKDLQTTSKELVQISGYCYWEILDPRGPGVLDKRSILKHGITSFNFVIYYYHEDPAVILTDVETKVIQSFPFEELFNFKKEADSMLGYKHTAEAIEKMKLRFVDKTNHPPAFLS